MVKVVIDIEKEIMAIDGELPAGEEALLLESGSRHENLWSINIYGSNPKLWRSYFHEFNYAARLKIK